MATKMSGFKVYKGTKEEFIKNNLATTYANAIVYITGGTTPDSKNSCIFAQGTYFGSIADLMQAINYVKGINVGGQDYNVAAGGGYIGFSATDPSTVIVATDQNGIKIGLTDSFVTTVNNTATLANNNNTNLGAKTDEANANGSAFARIANLVSQLNDLNGDGDGSIGKQISDAIDDLRTEIVGELDTDDAETIAAINDELNAIDTKFNSYVTTSTLNGLTASKNAGTNVKVTVETEGGNVSSVTVDETGLTTELGKKANSDDVYTKIDADTKVNTAKNEAINASALTITPATGTTNNILKTYTFTQNGKNIGTIDIAKDLVVTSGKIVEIEDKKYLQLTIANQTDPVNIAVEDLVDVYTAQSNATEVQVAISNANVVSASIVSGSIAKSKLETTVQTSLGKADTAVQKIATGSENGTIAVDGTNVAVKGLGSAAYTASTAYATAAQGTKADTALQTVSSANNYATVASKSSNNQAITVVSIDFSEVTAAGQGLADTYETKTYVDSLWEWEEI